MHILHVPVASIECIPLKIDYQIKRLFVHDLGTHYIRGINNRQQTWRFGKKRREMNMAPMNPTEEGLASLNTVVLREEPCLIRAAMLYYTVTKAASLSFCELFNDLGKYIKNPHTRWDYCLRAKRGYEDTSQPGKITFKILTLSLQNGPV